MPARPVPSKLAIFPTDQKEIAAMATEMNPFGDITKMMEQFKMPGIDMTAIMEARRKDIEAVVEANKAAFESMKALGAKQTEMFQQAMADIQQAAQTQGTSIGLGDPAKQTELVRNACQKALADMKELAEMARQSQADAMSHITRRATENMQEIKNLMTPKT
jgi:phasin family protein